MAETAITPASFRPKACRNLIRICRQKNFIWHTFSGYTLKGFAYLFF